MKSVDHIANVCQDTVQPHCNTSSYKIEPPHGKTNNLHRRKQRRRSANGHREADQRLCFRYSDSTIPLYLTPKFQASSSFLCLYRPVCVGPVRKPHCWFSHEVAQMYNVDFNFNSWGTYFLIQYKRLCHSLTKYYFAIIVL